jgi:hypothetical protein
VSVSRALPIAKRQNSRLCDVLVQSPASTSMLPRSSTRGMNAFFFEEDKNGSVGNNVDRGLEMETVFDVLRLARENWKDDDGAKTYAMLPFFVERIRVGLSSEKANPHETPKARKKARYIDLCQQLVVLGCNSNCFDKSLTKALPIFRLESRYNLQKERTCFVKTAQVE